MNKYTINNVFIRTFPHQIWKIQVDCQSSQLALELRDPSSSQASIYVLDFDGRVILADFQLPEKEWTLDAIQQERLIFKKVGDQTPTKAGIMIVNLNGEQIIIDEAYTLLSTLESVVKVRHRNFESGFESYISLFDGSNSKESADSLPASNLQIPNPYLGELPEFLKNKSIADSLWISKSADYFLWSYHEKTNQGYRLNLCVSNHSKIIQEIELLQNMPKMIPQPYFQIGRQLFVLAYNKCEILSYLV